MMINNRFSITLQCGETISSWTVNHMDCDLGELYEAFKGLLVTHGFTEQCINNYLKELKYEVED